MNQFMLFFYWMCEPVFPVTVAIKITLVSGSTVSSDTSVTLIATAVGNTCPHVQWKNTVSWFTVHWITLYNYHI